MLGAAMEKALNKQITAEFESFYVYRQMQGYFQDLNLDGFAHWLDMQAQEEHIHAMKIFEFVLDRGGKIELGAIGAPPKTWESPLAAAEAALAHERHISSLINDLVNQAKDDRDNPTETFLRWFVEEQVEEEASVDRIVQRMKLAADSSAALLMIDTELAGRQPEAAE